MNKIDELLRFDPLDTAEKITGSKIEDKDSPGLGLGFALAHAHARAKEEALLELDDTVHGDELTRYQRIITKFGFEEVLVETFTSRGDENRLFIYAHRDGLLLKFDTYHNRTVNGGNVYYNWRPLVDDWSRCTSSGSFVSDDVWAGDHDCREALIHNLNKLRNRGEFVFPWIAPKFLWLLHHGDTKVDGYDYKTINAERLAKLPKWVQDFVGTEESS